MRNDFLLNEVEIDYTPFFETIKHKGLTQSALIKKYDLSAATVYRLRNNNNMTLAALGHVMNVIGTDDINEVVRLVIRQQENTSQ